MLRRRRTTFDSPAPARLPPMLSELEAQFQDKPWLGSSTGAMLVPPAVTEPGPQPGPSLAETIERPPWVDEHGRLDFTCGSASPTQPAQPIEGDALAEMKRRDGDYAPREWGPPVPPAAPMPRPRFPEPNWAEEAAEAALRAPQVEHEPAKSLLERPAPPRSAA